MFMLNVPRRRGFTLVELLVVIAIIGILIALLLPAVQAAREAARRMMCANHLKQLALGALNYESSNKNFPICISHLDVDTKAEWNGISWMVGILPFIEQQQVFDSLYLDGNAQDGAGICHPSNQPWIEKPIPEFYCPSDDAMGKTRDDIWMTPPGRRFAVTNYAGMMGPHDAGNSSRWGGEPDCHNYSSLGTEECLGTFWRHSSVAPPTISSFTDGTSKTIIVGEVLPEYDLFLCWALSNGTLGVANMPLNWFPSEDPSSGNPPLAWSMWTDWFGFRSRHPGGVNFAYADGHVEFLNETIDMTVYRGLSTRSHGENVSYP